MKKRCLALLLMLCMTLSLLPAAAGADSYAWAESTDAFATYMKDTFHITVKETAETSPDMRRRIASSFGGITKDTVCAVIDKWGEFGRKTFYLNIQFEKGALAATTNFTSNSVTINVYGNQPANAGYVLHEFGHVVHELLRKCDSGFDDTFKSYNGGKSYGTGWSQSDRDYFIGDYGKSKIQEDVATIFENIIIEGSFLATLCDAVPLYKKSMFLREMCRKYLGEFPSLDYMDNITPPDSVQTSPKVIFDGTKYPLNAAGLSSALKAVSEGGTLDIQKDVPLASGVTIKKGVTVTSSNGSVLERQSSFTKGSMITVDAPEKGVTIKNLTIDGRSVATTDMSCGVYQINGTLTLEEGTVVQNCAEYGVHNMGNPETSFTEMTGGLIQNNGTGVYSNGGVMRIKGGKITDNASKGEGAGLLMAHGFVELSGSVTITGNTNKNGASNVSIPATQYLVIAGPLTGSVGINLWEYPTTKTNKPVSVATNRTYEGGYLTTAADAAHVTPDKAKDSTGKISYYVVDHNGALVMAAVSGNPTELKFKKTEATLKTGELFKNPATIATPGAAGGIRYTSSDKNVVTVEPTGELIGKGNGTATITALVGDGSCKASYQVTVEGDVAPIAVTPATAALKVKGTVQLEVALSPLNAQQGVVYSTSNARVATVSAKGLVTAVAEGTATITATAGGAAATCELTVTALPPKGLTLNSAPAKKDYALGEGFDPAGFSATYSDGKTAKELSAADVKFTTADNVDITTGRAFTVAGTKSLVASYSGYKVYFKIEVSEKAKPAVPATATATPSPTKLTVDGKAVSVDAYAINQNNYIKLRDLAYIINGTGKNFEVKWDGPKNAINLISKTAYTPTKSDMASGDGQARSATLATSKIYVDGVETPLTAYVIGQNNYFKLRDVMQVFNVGVGYDGATGTASLETSKSYVAP